MSSLAWLDGARLSRQRAERGVEEGAVQPVPRSGGRLRHWRDLQGRAERLRRWCAGRPNEASPSALAHDCRRRSIRSAAAGVPVLVLNPLAWKRTGRGRGPTCRCRGPTADGVSVLDAQSRRAAVAGALEQTRRTNTYHLLVESKDVPSLGYEVLHVVPGKRGTSRAI